MRMVLMLKVFPWTTLVRSENFVWNVVLVVNMESRASAFTVKMAKHPCGCKGFLVGDQRYRCTLIDGVIKHFGPGFWGIQIQKVVCP